MLIAIAAVAVFLTLSLVPQAGRHISSFELLSNDLFCFAASQIPDSPTCGNSRQLYDNLDNNGSSGTSEQYSLAEDQLSPNGKWHDVFNGYGNATIRFDPTIGHNVLHLEPKASTQRNETHSTLVETTQTFRNFDLALNMKTEKQLRENLVPNPWETGWIIFNSVDKWHSYFFVLKPNGIELGKLDNNDHQHGQTFLMTSEYPRERIGDWQHVELRVIADRISIAVNGTKVADYYDDSMSQIFDQGGSIGLYCEDAAVSFSNVYITPLTA